MDNIDNELLGDTKLFIALRLELNRLFGSLCKFGKTDNLADKRVGLYKYLQKLLPCFDILLKISNTESIQSLFTIQRMIFDNYAILFLLTSFDTNDQRKLRYYLYLLDSTISRPKFLESFMEKSLYSKDRTMPDKAIEADQKATGQLLQLISNLKTDVNKCIIDECNWKFIDISSSKNKKQNQYSWEQLYIIAKIKPNIAEMIQKYFSSFVHGLGLSLITVDGMDDRIFKNIAILHSSIIQGHIIRILLNEYPNETKDIKLHEGTLKFLEEIEKE